MSKTGQTDLIIRRALGLNQGFKHDPYRFYSNVNPSGRLVQSTGKNDGEGQGRY